MITRRHCSSRQRHGASFVPQPGGESLPIWQLRHRCRTTSHFVAPLALPFFDTDLRAALRLCPKARRCLAAHGFRHGAAGL